MNCPYRVYFCLSPIIVGIVVSLLSSKQEAAEKFAEVENRIDISSQN
jgi:hypothetical protein